MKRTLDLLSDINYYCDKINDAIKKNLIADKEYFLSDFTAIVKDLEKIEKAIKQNRNIKKEKEQK